MRVEGLNNIDYSSLVSSKNSDNTSYTKPSNLNEEIQKKQIISQLQRIDQKVKSHEMAHLSAAGGIAKGGANYKYIKGPDGKEYAIAGDVSIDVSPAKTPEETIKKMDRVIAAALAPADPSPQDLKVAAQAALMKIKAQIEYSKMQKEMTLEGSVSVYA